MLVVLPKFPSATNKIAARPRNTAPRTMGNTGLPTSGREATERDWAGVGGDRGAGPDNERNAGQERDGPGSDEASTLPNP